MKNNWKYCICGHAEGHHLENGKCLATEVSYPCKKGCLGFKEKIKRVLSDG